MNRKLIRYFSFMLLLVVFSAMVYAKGGGDKKSSPSSIQGSPSWTHLNINQLDTWFQNTGSSDINQQNNSGLVYPKGSGRTAAFQSGFLWGGKVDGTWSVGGSTYYQGCVPGRIKADGTAANPDDADVRIYRVRRDYKDPNADFSSEVNDGEGTAAQIYAQYDLDWKQWPANRTSPASTTDPYNQGAPYEDVNGDGKYDPNVDIPGVAGADQTIWFVQNDLDAAAMNGMYGGAPMGIEEQVTVFAYKATGALGNMFFRKFIIINKNPNKKEFTEMYTSMWSDVDLGDAGDDYVGCDTTLSMMYFYNGKSIDLVYNPLPPPATGFDFFQGPKVPGAATDQAIFKGKKISGFKNLPMTGFYFFINPDAVYADPGRANYNTGALEWYNLFRGRVSTSGQQFTDPTSGKVTMYPLAGDPITRSGWIDGMLHPPADRRGGMTSGPFTMAYGDTQEVVVSEMCAGATPGVDKLGAVQLLKFYDLTAQVAYNSFFNVPKAPQQPNVAATELDKEIVLSWGADFATVAKTEAYSQLGYKFEGYVVYQLPSGPSQEAIASNKVVKTFDIIGNGLAKLTDQVFDAVSGTVGPKVVIMGEDLGVQRFISIKNDAFNGGSLLRNGTRYRFAVTSYAYNPDPAAVPHVLENAMQIIEVTPHALNPGISVPASTAQMVPVTHSAGVADGQVLVKVADPTKITGNDYEMAFTFNDSVEISGVKFPNTKWQITNKTTSKVVYSGGTDYSLSPDPNTKVIVNNPWNPIMEGFQIGINAAPFWSEGKEIGSATYTPAANFNWSGINAGLAFNPLGQAANGDGGLDVGVNFRGSTLNPWEVNKSVEIRFSTTNKQKAYRYTRTSTGTGPSLCDGYLDQPFTVWDVTSSPAKQISFAFLESSTSSYYNGVWDVGGSSAGGDREYFYIFDSPYASTADPLSLLGKTESATISNLPCLYAGWFYKTDAAKPPYQSGDVYRINATLTIKPGTDKWAFSTSSIKPTLTVQADKAKSDVDQINVFPNPYYGVNPQEINKYQRFVTLTHLPQNATIRIFNLAGQLVRTLQKSTPDQFFRWDLANENQLPVASGLYILYVDMPDLGKTKILKVSIIQEQQVLDRF